jgi:adenine-specific DNA-methyltransferase
MHPFARTLRKEATVPERILWSKLRGRQFLGFRFRRQRPIGPYICDFVCLSEKVIVEVDGSQHVKQSNYDHRRDAFLRASGFRVLRFWNGDVVERLETVLETIREALFRQEMDGRFD